MKPLLTVGLPAYNNAATLETAVRSLLNQSFRNFILVISDDCSTDQTEAVGRRLAAEDARIEYLRQPVNLKYRNFGFLLHRASTPYFMWAAGDDYWEPEFIARCIQALDQRPDAVLACPQVEFTDAQSGRRWLAKGTFEIEHPEWPERVRAYLADPADNSRMYGVFRTREAQLSFPDDTFHAYDWAFSAALLKHGSHLQLRTVEMRRDKTPTRRYLRLAEADARHWLDRWLPIWRMSLWLLQQGRLPRSPSVLWTLFRLNAMKHRQMVDDRWPLIYHPVKALQAAVRKLFRIAGR